MQKSLEDTNISKGITSHIQLQGKNYYFLSLYSQKIDPCKISAITIFFGPVFLEDPLLFAYALLDASRKTCVGRDSEQLNLCTLSPPLSTLKTSRISSNVFPPQDKESMFHVDISFSTSLKKSAFSKTFSSCYVVSELGDLKSTWYKMLVSHEHTRWQKGCHLLNSLLYFLVFNLLFWSV